MLYSKDHSFIIEVSAAHLELAHMLIHGECIEAHWAHKCHMSCLQTSHLMPLFYICCCGCFVVDVVAAAPAAVVFAVIAAVVFAVIAVDV